MQDILTDNDFQKWYEKEFYERYGNASHCEIANAIYFIRNVKNFEDTLENDMKKQTIDLDKKTDNDIVNNYNRDMSRKGGFCFDREL